MLDTVTVVADRHSSLPWPEGWGSSPRTRKLPVRASLGEVRTSRSVIRGVQFPFRVKYSVLVLSGLLSLLLLAGSVVLLVAAIREAEYFGFIGVAVLAGLGMVFGAVVVSFLARDRTNPLGITMGDREIVKAQGQPVVIPWSTVTAIRAIQLRFAIGWSLFPPPRRNWITIEVEDLHSVQGPGARTRALARRFGANTATGFAAASVDGNALILYHALRFYLENPDARHELTNERGLDRVSNARFMSTSSDSE